jgi:hypothetical protein
MGETICAQCCGTEREVTIDCTPDCGYLIAAHRYEAEKRSTLTPADIPFPNVEIPLSLIQEYRGVVSGLAFAILKAAGTQPSIVDKDALAALQALAEKFRTLGSGIYYEKPPDDFYARAVYEALDKYVEEFKRQLAEQGIAAKLKDRDVFHFLVFLLRVGRGQTNGRPRSRMYLEFLRGQFPKAAAVEEPSRIIVP